MELSLALAKVIGLTLMLVAAALLVNRKNIDLLFDLYGHPEAVLLTGILETVLGILFVLAHNVWTRDFRVIITVIGYILLLRGLVRIFYPSRTVHMLEKFKKRQSVFEPLLLFVYLIGAYLVYIGFIK